MYIDFIAYQHFCHPRSTEVGPAIDWTSARPMAKEPPIGPKVVVNIPAHIVEANEPQRLQYPTLQSARDVLGEGWGWKSLGADSAASSYEPWRVYEEHEIDKAFCVYDIRKIGVATIDGSDFVIARVGRLRPAQLFNKYERGSNTTAFQKRKYLVG